MNSREIIKLRGGAQLRLHRAGSGNNWIFLPGGPGLGAECFDSLFDGWRTDSNLWTLEYCLSKDCSDWRLGVLDLSTRLKQIILVGHSYGGMLLLSIKGLEQQLGRALRGWVFLASSPSLVWMKLWPKQKSVYPAVFRAAQEIERAFAKTPTAPGYQRMLDAWAPYYFEPSAVEKGRAMLRSCHCFPHAYALAGRILADYGAQWVPLKKTLILAGENDRVTPMKCFSEDERFRGSNMAFSLIPGAGHFPWVENLPAVTAALEAHFQNSPTTDVPHPPRCA